MDSIQDLLGKRVPQEPPEIGIIKRYVREHFKSEIGVTVHEREIVINAASAALANAIKLRGPELLRACGTDKRLIVRIGRSNA